jgi:ribulose-5-phosphate 4-epimerase/fuculose-1-phosphate aldolase
MMSSAIHVNREEMRLREHIVQIGQSIFTRGLSSGSSGNISVRLDDGWLLTPTDSCLGDLDPAKLAKLDPDGRHLSGSTPSKELFLHNAVYAGRAAAKAIIHLHSTYGVAVSCLEGLDPENCLPPLTPYFFMKVGRLPLVPYSRPGDPQLADTIRRLVGKHRAVLLANHGPIVSGPSLKTALYSCEELEETAKIFLILRGLPARPLDDAQLDELRRVFDLDSSA